VKYRDHWLIILAIGYALANAVAFEAILREFGWEKGFAALVLLPPIVGTLAVIALSLTRIEFRLYSMAAFIGWMFVVGFVNAWLIGLAAANA
jgi:hypothetical protein